MILEVLILTISVGLASIMNFFIIPAITKSIAERLDEEEEIKPFPYTLMAVVNALTWLILTICFSFLGFLLWKTAGNPSAAKGFVSPLVDFLSNAFKGNYMMYPIFLGVATIAFIMMGTLISEGSTDIPINLDTSLKISLILPNHKTTSNKNNESGKEPKEVKVFQLVNLIMMVSTSIPAILALSS